MRRLHLCLGRHRAAEREVTESSGDCAWWGEGEQEGSFEEIGAGKMGMGRDKRRY